MIFGDQIDKVIIGEQNAIKQLLLGLKVLVDYILEQCNGVDIRLFGIPILTINTQPVLKVTTNTNGQN